jgi:hypothetical protein
MILALLASRNVQLSVIAQYFAGSAKQESIFKRLQRFLKEVVLPSDRLATLILAILGFEKDEKIAIIFDRTNWKFGKIHLNLLFLCVVHRGASVPIFFTVLLNKKQGNSSYVERIDLMEKIIALIGRTSIAYVLGDREFCGKRWIVWLRKKKISFVMRLSEKKTKIANNGVDFICAHDLFAQLKKGRSRSLGYSLIGESDSFKACVSVLRTYKSELVVVIHSDDIKNPLHYYKERWRIESMFKIMKTGGFNLENTHVCEPKRLSNLISILVLAFCFALKAGRLVAAKSRTRLKNNGYFPKSIVRLGLDALFKSIFYRGERQAEESFEENVFRLEEVFVL